MKTEAVCHAIPFLRARRERAAALDTVHLRQARRPPDRANTPRRTLPPPVITMAEMEQSGIQVVVRLRPMSERELKGNTLPVVTASTEKREVTVIKGTGARTLRSTFAFDNVFTARPLPPRPTPTAPSLAPVESEFSPGTNLGI